MNTPPNPICITTGEPAGIGPDISLSIAAERCHDPVPPVLVGDPALLAERAHLIGISKPFHILESIHSSPKMGCVNVSPVFLKQPCQPGLLNPANADYVLDTLRHAVNAIQHHAWSAMVTAPVHKGVINQSGRYFQGHTEFLAELTNTPHVVMMLTANQLRVALATTHIPINEVSKTLNTTDLIKTLSIIHADFQSLYGITNPRIGVCGLNPHAGEQGHLGREEIDIIQPAIDYVTQLGINASNPLPADTIFTARQLQHFDVILSMFHDQGLPVLKYAGFGNAINVTLGLPIVRTSVDHGTALDLAGKGEATTTSLHSALKEASIMVACRSQASLTHHASTSEPQ